MASYNKQYTNTHFSILRTLIVLVFLNFTIFRTSNCALCEHCWLLCPQHRCTYNVECAFWNRKHSYHFTFSHWSAHLALDCNRKLNCFTRLLWVTQITIAIKCLHFITTNRPYKSVFILTDFCLIISVIFNTHKTTHPPCDVWRHNMLNSYNNNIKYCVNIMKGS